MWSTTAAGLLCLELEREFPGGRILTEREIRALDWAEMGRKPKDEGRGGPRSIIDQSQESPR